MKHAAKLLLVIWTLAGVCGAGQSRPTLRRGPSRGYSAPNNSYTANPQMLLRTHTIFVEPIGHGLSRELVNGLKRLDWARVVTHRRQADAILGGTCFEAEHLKLVHSELFLSKRASHAAIWQDDLRVPYNPPPTAQAVAETAHAFLVHLRESISRAHSR